MSSNAEYDYIVVGSGAGGGPLAANLAKAGFRVLLMEAGGDPCSDNETGRLMYEGPIFHGLSTEYKPCAWDFFVRHYTDEELQAADSKVVPEELLPPDLTGKKMVRSEEHTSELQSRQYLVCRLLLEKKNLRDVHRTTAHGASLT